MLRMMLALLFVAGLFSCLFSVLLPPSAALLAPTSTLTPTVTPTPTATPTQTSTITPLPAKFITPYVTEVGIYTSVWRRTLWESAVGETFVIEGFEHDSIDYRELGLPYMTENGFLFNGKSHAQMLNGTELLPSGNLLHFRDWEQGLTITFPDDRAARAFGFDYTTNEEWRLTFNNVEITLPTGRNMFVGIILSQDFPKGFTLSSHEHAQGGLSVDNISYIP